MRNSFLVSVALLSACATTQPDTPVQAKTRAALEACQVETGRFAYNLEVDAEGRYSWKTPSGGAQTTAMMDCMRGKGYAPVRR